MIYSSNILLDKVFIMKSVGSNGDDMNESFQLGFCCSKAFNILLLFIKLSSDKIVLNLFVIEL